MDFDVVRGAGLLDKITKFDDVRARLLALVFTSSVGLFGGSIPQVFAGASQVQMPNPDSAAVSNNPPIGLRAERDPAGSVSAIAALEESEDEIELAEVDLDVSAIDEEPLPQAKSVELDEPIIDPEAADKVQVSVDQPSPTVNNEVRVKQTSPAVVEVEAPIAPMVILGTEVPPATATRLSWSPNHSFEGISSPTPILIVNGSKPGPVLCLTAAIHGDELNGIEIVRRVLYNIEAESLVGSVIGVPIVNLEGFRRTSRYLTDRRDLNRSFPGNPRGSSAARIAHSFFTQVITHCDALVDLHTGSFHRTNLPQLRADITKPTVVSLTQGFGSTVVLQSIGGRGTLRRAAVDAGIPAVTLEAGESMRLQEDAVDHGVRGIRTLMHKLGMLEKFSFWGDPEPVYYNSAWVRADLGGILFRNVELGDRVVTGDVLGVVTDPITNVRDEIVASYDGRVIGMALNQVVLPGFAAFHIGIKTPQALILEPEKIVPQGAEGLDELSDADTPAVRESSADPKQSPAMTTVVANPTQESVLPAKETADGTPITSDETVSQEVMEETQSEVDDYD